MKPTIVTGKGRSGTHWLAHVLSHFADARHEPENYREGGEIIVDCRLWQQVERLRSEGYEVRHLIRDGREVVRSADQFYQGRNDFAELCESWAMVVDELDSKEVPVMRLRDLVRKQDASQGYRLSHWSEWPDYMTDTFWRICGDAMRRHGYDQ